MTSARTSPCICRNGRAPDGTRIVSAKRHPGPSLHRGRVAHLVVGRTAPTPATPWVGLLGGPWEQPTVFHPGNSPGLLGDDRSFPGRGLAAATLVPASQELLCLATRHCPTGSPATRCVRCSVSRSRPPRAGGASTPTSTLPQSRCSHSAHGRSPGAAKARRLRRGPLRRWLQPLPSLTAALSIAVLPRLSGYGWAGVWTWAPDLALLLMVLAALAAATAALRLMNAVGWGARDGGPSVPDRRRLAISASTVTRTNQWPPLTTTSKMGPWRRSASDS